MTTPQARAAPAFFEDRLFPVEVFDAQLQIRINLSSQVGPNHIGVDLVDALDGHRLLAKTLHPVTNTSDVEQVLEVVADAVRMALQHLTPFPI